MFEIGHEMPLLDGAGKVIRYSSSHSISLHLNLNTTLVCYQIFSSIVFNILYFQSFMGNIEGIKTRNFETKQ